MQKGKYLILLCLSLFFDLANAQDIGNFTQFFFNPYTLNPSFAGIDGRGAIFLAYRKQWSGVEGSPTISNFTFHAPLNSGLSMGINAANDKRGILSNSGLMFTMAYSLSLGESKFVRFGLSGGGSWNTVDLDKIQNMTSDPALANLLNKSASINGNAGISLHLKTFHAGFALPNLFTPSYVSTDAFTVTEVKPFQAFVAHASNRFYFADNKHVFEPYVVYRINDGLPSQYEVAGVVHLNHLIWLGGSMKQEFGISAFGGVKLNKVLAIGGSYTLKNSGANELNFPSYEIQLNYLGGAPKPSNKSKTKSQRLPSYSFLDTEIKKLTTREKRQEELAKKAAEEKKAKEALAKKQAEEKKAQEALAKKEADRKAEEAAAAAALAKKEEEKKAAAAAAVTTAAVVKKEPEEKKVSETTVAQKEPEVKPQTQEPAPVVTEEIIEPADIKHKPRFSHKSETDIDENEPFEEVVHGPHPQELTPGAYVIVDALGLEAEAKTEVNKISSSGVIAKYGYITEKGLWYVYIFRSQDTQVARTEREKYLKMPEFNNTRILQVDAEKNERHEYVSRGDHAEELNLGNYVIVGAFSTAPHANDFAKQIKSSGLNANYGHLTKKNFWYVYVFADRDINKARTERDRIHNMPKFSHAWLLTVQE